MVTNVFIARIFLIGLGVIAVYTAVSNKSPDEVSLIPCLFQSITDIPCPGCGMTRACLSLSHGQFIDAWRFHPFSFKIVGIALTIAIFPTKMMAIWSHQSSKTRNLIAFIGIFLCLSIWIIKLTSTVE